MNPRLLLAAVFALAAGACTTADARDDATTTAPRSTAPTTVATTVAPSTTTTTTTTLPPTFIVRGTVTDAAGSPLEGAIAELAPDDGAAPIVGVADAAGSFTLIDVPAGALTVSRPGWLPQSVEWSGSASVAVTLEPMIVRGIRVSRYVAADSDMYADLLELVAPTVVNALVFDTKDETGTVLYETAVAYAAEIDAVRPVYDPEVYLEAARGAGLYTITRIVTFEDEVWSRAAPDTKLAGYWMDAADPVNWEYPLQLAVEACELGFDEVQFDYVRFPAGRTARVAQQRRPTTQEERTTAIASFLGQATARLHPMGCAVSADVFGIVLSAANDQGIGQRPEDLSGVIDAVSPMIYPSHYSDGWLNLEDPNDHPGPVVADALDSGAPRLGPTTLMRPWLQAFYYDGDQVKAEIAEAEARGMGWMLWNAAGNYAASWLPTELPSAG